MSRDGGDGSPHTPVLAAEVAGILVPRTGNQVLVDCTVGAGGHAAVLLESMGSGGRLLGIDRDPEALALAGERLEPYGEHVRLVRGRFAHLEEIVTEHGWGDAPAGILYDLGVSSMHLDRPSRGFSYHHDGPLDMRMDPASALTAREVVNTYTESDLTRVLRVYGEERWASRIAGFIVRARQRRPLSTTGELVAIIRDAVPAAARRGRPHPARRTFQALRIEVNRELADLEETLPQAAGTLAPGGRLAVLSYQSLEDRIVKRFLRAEAGAEEPRLRLLTRRPVRPTAEETARNRRASAARLRAAERLAAPPQPASPPAGRVA